MHFTGQGRQVQHPCPTVVALSNLSDGGVEELSGRFEDLSGRFQTSSGGSNISGVSNSYRGFEIVSGRFETRYCVSRHPFHFRNRHATEPSYAALFQH